MADEATPKPATRKGRTPKAAAERDAAPAKEAKSTPAKSGTKAPRRPTIDPETTRLLRIRDAEDRRRPTFGRQAANRYWRIGRRGAWRRPRGIQSKQRRHYGYRPEIVKIGYGSPAATRGLTPTGFRPVVVRTPADIDALDASLEAAIIGRTVGTRRRLVLEETARQKGIHVLNPLVAERAEA